MFGLLEDNKTVVDETAEDDRFKMGGTVIYPFLFMITEKYIGEGRTKGGAHGHSINLLVKFAIKKKYGVICS